MNNRFSINLKIVSFKKQFFKTIFLAFLMFFISNFIFINLTYATYDNSFAKNNHSRASIDIDGNIYMRENIYKKIYPASMTKIAISIIAIEKLDLNDKIYIEEIDYKLPLDYVTTPLYVGEVVTAEDLIYANMLKSGNDASIYLAKHIFGDNDSFVKGINEYLKEIGLKNTNFTNPFGLHEEEHYTTPYDILILSKHAMQNDVFRNVVNTSNYIIPENNFSEPRVLKTTSLFATKDSSLFNKDFEGIKTGFTEEAGDCFVTSSKILDKEFYFVYTGADSRVAKFEKIQKMYDETKYILEQKEIADTYSKTNYNNEKNKIFNTNYINSKLFFTGYDKILFFLFLLFSLYIIKIMFLSKFKR